MQLLLWACLVDKLMLMASPCAFSSRDTTGLRAPHSAFRDSGDIDNVPAGVRLGAFSIKAFSSSNAAASCMTG